MKACLLKEKARHQGSQLENKEKVSLDQLQFGEVFERKIWFREDVPRLELDQAANKTLCELLGGQRNVATTGVVSPVSMPCRSLVLTMIAFPSF
jgi:hypothetical protein